MSVERAKIGRPFLGYTAQVLVHVRPEIKRWLQALARVEEITEGEVVRRILAQARAKGWTP